MARLNSLVSLCVYCQNSVWLVLAFCLGVLPMKISFAVIQIKINVFAFR